MCPRNTTSDDNRVALLEDLKSLTKGGADEFEPHELRRTHLPIPEHRHVLDRETLLILGGRGTGKTRLFNVLRQMDNPTQLLTPSAGADGSGQGEQYTPGFGGPGRLFPHKTVLTSLISAGELLDPERFWAGMLAGVLLQHEPTKSAVSAVLEPELQHALAQDLPTPKPWLSIIKDPDKCNCLYNALDRADKSLEDQRRTLFVTYDDLDRLVSETSSTYPLVKGLLAFWLDNVRRWSAIRCKIFLRTDIFAAEEIAFTDSSKLRPLSVTLRWNPANLYRLVLKRVLNGNLRREWLQFVGRSIPKSKLSVIEPWGIVPTTGESDHRAFMERLVGQYMGADKRRGDTYQWFLNHLQDSRGDIAPRSFLKLFEIAAERQIDAGLLDSAKLIAPELVNEALKVVSKDRIGELKEEYKWIESIGSNLKGQLVPMKRADFSRSCLRDIEWNKFPEHLHNQKDRLVDYLLSLGILRETSDKRDKRIHVPDIYLFGFDLKRKGGIRRPKP
jgi:hypothetical protein